MNMVTEDTNEGSSSTACSAQSETARRGTGAENGQPGLASQAQSLPLDELLMLPGIFEIRVA